MPQVVLEFTGNIGSTDDFRRTALKLHHLLVEEIATDLPSCKTRLTEISDFVIADGAADLAFIHVTIAILSGRSQEMKVSLASKALALVSADVPSRAAAQNIQITIEIRDLDGSTYQKHIVRKSDLVEA